MKCLQCNHSVKIKKKKIMGDKRHYLVYCKTCGERKIIIEHVILS